MLSTAKVTGDHTTHLTRGCASRLAELLGVSEDQIRRLGHWQAGAMERHYLSALPRKGMRAMAGFTDFSKPGFYYLKRDLLEPPQSLKSQIFPQLEDWLSRYENDECQQTLSCLGFLNLLKYLRTTILQDSVILKEKYPNLFVWRHPVFLDPEFARWSSDLKTAMQTATEPAEFTIRAAVPTIANELERSRQSIHQVLDVIQNKIDRQGEEIYANGRKIHNLSEQLKEGFRIVPNGNFRSLEAMNLSRLNNASTSIPPNPSITSQREVPEHHQENTDNNSREQGQYRMRRDPNMDVSALWDEWKFQVEGLERDYGTLWRRGSESRYFQRRKYIIDAVQSRIESGLSSHEAVAEMERLRDGASLHSLYEKLKARQQHSAQNPSF
jgi:hypothetical protein